MATFTSRTVTSTRREWVVPAAQPWGASLGDVRTAIALASAAYQETHELPEDEPLPDDALRFHVRDEEIVISFTVEHDARIVWADQPDTSPDSSADTHTDNPATSADTARTTPDSGVGERGATEGGVS